jgi:hypothetical protein
VTYLPGSCEQCPEICGFLEEEHSMAIILSLSVIARHLLDGNIREELVVEEADFG